VVFPRSTEEVVELVNWARSCGKALVPSGGRTGLSGGAVAARGEVVVSLERMRAMIELDHDDPSLTVEAGMAVGQVQKLAADAGWYYPVDWAAAGSSQVGGSIATNAGGIRVLRYGMTRDWVRGLQVVTGRGEVLELNRGLVKNNTGFDLRQLMVGSEGTLGIVTQATLGLARPPPEQSVLLLGFVELDAIMPAFARLRKALNLSAFEFFDRRSIEQVAAASGQAFPLDGDCPFHAVVEFDDPGQALQEQALALFEALVEEGLVGDGTISQSGAQAAELWHWREAISESIAPRTPYKNDLSVRVGRVPAFLRDLDASGRRALPGVRGGLVRPYRRWQPAHERAPARGLVAGGFPCRRQGPESARIRAGPASPGQRLGRAWRRPAQARGPGLEPQPGRAGSDARHQGPVRPGRHPQSRQTDPRLMPGLAAC
jgi:FAD/FMN-containing dehydrogenase